MFKNVTKYYIENNIQILTLILKTKNRHNTVHWLPGPRLNRTISNLSYDHLPTMFATVSQNLSKCFYDFRFVVMTSSLCGGTKINQFNRAAHLSDKFIRSNKILNIKYSYFIGLCRYKILNIVILLVFVDTNHTTPYESRRRQFQSEDCFLRECSAVE